MSFSASNAIDTHVHLASSLLPNPWADEDLNKDAAAIFPSRAVQVNREAGDLTEENFILAAAKGAEATQIIVKRAIFVECFNTPPVEEAKWALA